MNCCCPFLSRGAVRTGRSWSKSSELSESNQVLVADLDFNVVMWEKCICDYAEVIYLYHLL